MCSGKIYYDLLEAREKNKNDKVVFIRIEQLYPFPAKTLARTIERYQNAKFYWCQEELKIWEHGIQLEIILIELLK